MSGRSKLPAETAGDATGSQSKDVMRRYRRLAVLFDLACASVASLASVTARFGDDVTPFYWAAAGFLPVVWVVLVRLQRGYEDRYLATGPEEFRRVVWAGLGLVAVVSVGAFTLKADVARGFVLVAIPLTVGLSLLGRALLRRRIHRLRAAGIGVRPTLVVGRADAVLEVMQRFDREPEHGFAAVGAVVPKVGIEVSHVNGVPVVGDPDTILEAVDATGAQVVAVVSHPDLSGQALRHLSWALDARDVDLLVSAGIVEVSGPRLSIRPIAGLSLLHLEAPPGRGGRMVLKSAFDRFAALAISVMISPVLLVVALAVKVSSPGPVFFRQKRVGIDGREFGMLKFRSMVVNAEQMVADLRAQGDDGNGVLFKMRHDPRVTRVGAVLRRYSLDELPQILNVVRGEMSLVGPRPPLPQEVATYSSDAFRRLYVRPGMTGLWQVSGRSDLSWEESLRLDLRYADNWSIPLDLSIMWRTLRAVLRGAGAY